MSEAIEVWIPEGLKERLHVGARVRVRLSGECDYAAEIYCETHGGQADIVGHNAAENGLTGRITEIAQEGTHPYGIVFEATPLADFTTPCCPGGILTDGVFAAVELIPLDGDAVQR